MLAERHGDALDRPGLEPPEPLLTPHELGQSCAIALHDRQPHDAVVATGAPCVDRHLEVRPVPCRERTRDDGQLAGIALQVLA